MRKTVGILGLCGILAGCGQVGLLPSANPTQSEGQTRPQSRPDALQTMSVAELPEFVIFKITPSCVSVCVVVPPECVTELDVQEPKSVKETESASSAITHI